MSVRQSLLLHELLNDSDALARGAVALTYGDQHLTYPELQRAISGFAQGLLGQGLKDADRVAVYLEKRFEMVIGCFGTSQAGGAFVPLNPLLKPEQVAHILQDAGVRYLLTSPERLKTLRDILSACPALAHIILTESPAEPVDTAMPQHLWSSWLTAPVAAGYRRVDTDMAAILYTSGSTGRPKGVVVSHRNLVCGAKSVASYLENCSDDVLLAALPLSFDAGFSQLTTAFHVGARVVLLNYLFPRDVLKAMVREKVTGLTAVPPLYIQLAGLDWPTEIAGQLRYFANTGGRMPFEILRQLRDRLPNTLPYLMYGLTEAFRSTYLPPDEVDRRPDSIGRAIPNAEILVLREDGGVCEPEEPGELVHRGALVSLGYWNDPEKTAERFRPLPACVRPAGLVLPEVAVYSGDTVRRDAEGFLYFIGRRDEMIKTSGYRVSPTEVEEVLYASGQIGECAVFGVEHPRFGQAIQVVVTPLTGETTVDVPTLQAYCRDHLPVYMQPAGVEVQTAALPRNPNGKIDRKGLSTAWLARLHAGQELS